ncbi:MFS transporter [Streptomyces bauhiniae]|uniref:MFS transporter n=1 Tax=Streptomyces bauhiniae TaxID=2340725 RepID=UPI0035D5AF74
MTPVLFKSRHFVLLFLGQGVSRLGDGLYNAYAAWLAWSLTHNTEAVAFIATAAYAPTFLGTVVGASYADRYDRRRLMIGTDVVRAILTLLCAVLQWTDLMTYPLLVAAVALIGTVGAPFAPARNALVPQIVPKNRLLEANSLLQASFTSAYFVGPLLLLPLLAFTSSGWAFAVNTVTFVVSAVTLAALRFPVALRPKRPIGLRADLLEGWAVLRSAPEVLVVIGTFMLAILVASGFLSVGIIRLVDERLGGGGGTYGLLLGIAGVSEIAGAMVFARIPMRRLALVAVLAWALLGVFRFPLGLASSVEVAGPLLALTGFASALTDIPLVSLIQHRINDRHLAKALGLWEAAIAGAAAVAPFVASAIIARVGVTQGFMLSGIALVFLSIIATLVITRLTMTRPPHATTSPDLSVTGAQKETPPTAGPNGEVSI